MRISIVADIAKLRRQLDDAANRQLPFATSRALTAVARKGAEAERASISRDLDRPTPFTLRGVATKGASKRDLEAAVFLKPIQAEYLAPSIEGGPQLLGTKRGILDPVNAQLNRYGNLPRNLIARLKARRDVFIGAVDGVHGVWQRLPPPTRRERIGRYKGLPPRDYRPGRLKLLVRFAAPAQLPERYPFGAATVAVVNRDLAGELRRALDQALATAR